ncbi:spore germination protein [Piscibacillus salipiscarius]|uniref:spore germination protein n=1 Tax=Piscibacillus salipiscarius TaxID=299480 RepID=UPI0006D0CC46|nr:spore germination protein [Piscibacillus salipiscarius]
MNLDQSKLKLMFQGSEDVKFIEFTFDYNIKIMCIYCKGLCDKEFLMDEFIPTLEKHISEKLNKSNILKGYNKVNYQQLSKQEEIIEKVFSGELILYIQHEKKCVLFRARRPT